MSLFSFLSKPAWQSRNAAKRAEAVAHSREPALLPELPQILRNDPDAPVRRAALERIDDLTLIADRMSNDADAGVRDRARARLIDLLAGSAPIAERRRALGLVEEQALLEQVAKRAPEAELRAAALERCTRLGFIADRVLEDSDADLRLALLARVTATPTLERLAAHARTRDKRLYRAIRERLDADKYAAGEVQALIAKAEALCLSLEQLLRHPDAGTAELVARAEAEWPSLRAKIDERFDRRFDGAVQTLKAALSAIERIGEEPPVVETLAELQTESSDAQSEMPESEAEAVSTASDSILEDLCARVEALDDSAPTADLDALERRWQSAWQDSSKTAEAETLQASFQARIVILRESAKAHEARLEQGRVLALKTIEATAKAIEDGQLSAARAARAQARSAIESLPASAARALNRQLSELEPGIEKLSRWQRWSDNKVRVRLCEDVEALIGSGMHPDALANRVTELKQAWKRIDDSETDPGTPVAESGLGKRFRFLCHKALEPARGYFEKRKEVRGKRSEDFGVFIEQARAALAAESTEVSQLVTLKREAGDRLRRADEVDPRQRGEIGKQLKQLMEACSAAVDARFNAVAEEKQKLINQLRRQLAHAELDAALDLAKSAQKRWQTLGKGSHKTDQALWQEFRELVDPLFNQRNEELKAVDAERDAERASAQALIDELKSVAESDLDAAHIDAQIGRIESDWRADPKRARELERSFDAAVTAAQKSAAKRRSAELTAREQHAVELAEKLDAMEAEWLQGRDMAADLGAAKAALAGLDSTLGGSLGLRLIRLEQAGAGDRAELTSQQLAEAEKLLLEYEFLAGVDSPAEHQAARMNLQVEKLSARMSSGQSTDPKAERAALDMRWWSTGPITAADRERLAARRQRALEALGG
jgi:DNA repair protein SbcC/Rad50